MSYTTKIKNEIIELDLGKSETIALLSGFIRNNGSISNNELILTTENDLIKERIIYLLKKLYEINVVVEVKDGLNFNKKDLYVIHISEKLNLILQDVCYLDEKGIYMDTPKDYLVGGNEEIRAYLKGVFLTGGSINDPKTSRYHMEILMNEASEAVFVQKLLNIFDLNAKLLNRDKGYMVYIKEAERISDFLKIVGAMKAVLYFEDVRIYHETKNRTNRLNNCEQANTDKVIDAANEQLKNINILEDNLAVELLDDKTKEALDYRKKYPEASLKELSEIITIETGNKITKSGLNHRFRKINELASRLNKE